MGLLKRVYTVLYGKMLYKQNQEEPAHAMPQPEASSHASAPMRGYSPVPAAPLESKIDAAQYKYPEKRMGPDPDAPPWEPEQKPPLVKRQMGPK